MSVASYLLATVSSPDNLLPAIESINKLDTLLGWDAVDGHFDFVIKLSSASADALKSGGSISELNNMNVCDIINDNEKSLADDSELCRSYLFIETNQSNNAEVLNTIGQLESILFCSTTKGECDIVAVITGETFSDIERTIERIIRPLDGLLRIKTNRIIDLGKL